MTNNETRDPKYAQKATYTEDTFEAYYRELIERWCTENGIAFRLDEWDGARENMRDDAMTFDMETQTITDVPAYTDQDLIDEYLYFCLMDDLDGYTETSDWADNFDRKYLSPDYDPDTMTWSIYVYREGDKPYSHYDTGRMDLYRGTYTFDKANCTYHFTEPVKVEK